MTSITSSSSPSETQTTRKIWPIVMVALGFAPLMWWHIGGLLERPHYQFLFFLPVLLWMLIYGADTMTVESPTKSEATSGSVLLAIAFSGLAYAAWVWSPWIAAISFMIAAFAAALGICGWKGIRNWFHVWIFCWVIIPLPFGMDEDLIVYLRGITTRLSSSVLDQIGLLHNSYANVIELPGKPLFIADACSGIHSLYVLMAAALFLAMWQKRGIIHSTSLLISTFALVLIENVARIVMVAVLWTKGQDFSVGFKHESLGVALFCLSLLFMVSLDQLLVFLLPTRLPSPLNWAYAKLVGTPSGSTARKQQSSSIDSWQQRILFVAALFPLVGVGQLLRLPETRPSVIVDLYDDFELPDLGKSAMPETIGSFHLETYETVNRVPGDPMGQASQQWQYSDGITTALFSIDYPYTGVHDLCECYGAVGWDIPERSVIPEDELAIKYPELADGPLASGRLQRDLYGHGVLLFNLTDTNGRTHAIIKDLARKDAADRAAERLRSLNENKVASSQQAWAPPYIQYQLLARMPHEVTQKQLDDLIQFFFESKQVLRQRLAATETK